MSRRYFLFILFSLFLVGCTFTRFEYSSIFFFDGPIAVEGNPIIEKGGVFIEIADTPEERANGLMFRESLHENFGMLFIFDEEEKHSFWMKNTLIPLDIIFISSNLTVVDILYAIPCIREPCVTYTPHEKATYVLEVNANFTKEHDIQTGHHATIYYV